MILDEGMENYSKKQVLAIKKILPPTMKNMKPDIDSDFKIMNFSNTALEEIGLLSQGQWEPPRLES